MTKEALEYYREWRIRNPGKASEYCQRWRETHAEENKQYEHSRKRKKQKRAYCLKNKAKINEYQREYQREYRLKKKLSKRALMKKIDAIIKGTK